MGCGGSKDEASEPQANSMPEEEFSPPVQVYNQQPQAAPAQQLPWFLEYKEWKGHYVQFNQRHKMPNFPLMFGQPDEEGKCSIKAVGADDPGDYMITGEYDLETGKAVLAKDYGEWVVHVGLLWNTDKNRFEGKYFVDTQEGEWYIKPVVEKQPPPQPTYYPPEQPVYNQPPAYPPQQVNYEAQQYAQYPPQQPVYGQQPAYPPPMQPVMQPPPPMQPMMHPPPMQPVMQPPQMHPGMQPEVQVVYVQQPNVQQPPVVIVQETGESKKEKRKRKKQERKEKRQKRKDEKEAKRQAKKAEREAKKEAKKARKLAEKQAKEDAASSSSSSSSDAEEEEEEEVEESAEESDLGSCNSMGSAAGSIASIEAVVKNARKNSFGSVGSIGSCEPKQAPVTFLKFHDFEDEYGGMAEKYDNDSFAVRNSYLFSKQEFDLPIEISYLVTFTQEGEFHPCWSQSKKRFGHAQCDALSWFHGTSRHDFTFRTQMFGGFPSNERPHNGYKAEVGKLYHHEVEIHRRQAKFFIDGKLYASCTYNQSEVPQQGHVGFGIYARGEEKVIKNVRVRSI